MQDQRHTDRQRNRGGQNRGTDTRMERQTDRPHARPKAYGQRDRGGTESEGQIQGQTDRPHEGPEAHGQTEKEGDRNRGTDTGTDSQTSCRTQDKWTKRQRGTDPGTETDLMHDPRHVDKETEGDRKRGTDTGTETDGQTSCRTQGRGPASFRRW